MPESKGRPKPAYTPPRSAPVRKQRTNPRWWVPVMLGLMVLGLLWVAVYYISGTAEWPVPPLGRWNIAAGFGLILVGFGMTTRWY